MLSSQSREFHKFFCAINSCNYNTSDFRGILLFAKIVFSKFHILLAFSGKFFRSTNKNFRIFSRNFRSLETSRISSKILGLVNYSFRQTISTVKITKRHLMLKNANSLVLSNQDLLKA